MELVIPLQWVNSGAKAEFVPLPWKKTDWDDEA